MADEVKKNVTATLAKDETKVYIQVPSAYEETKAAVKALSSRDDVEKVAWAQSITLPWVPGRLRPAAAFVTRVAAPAIGAGYRRVVTKLLDPHR